MEEHLKRKKDILEILQSFQGMEPLKELFWSRLSYDRVNKPIPRTGWTKPQHDALGENPLLWASGGAGEAFHVIYMRLPSPDLKRAPERLAVNALLREHPYALFVISNDAQTQWHFLNVKYDDRMQNRQLFRRISIGPSERLRTAAERISMLDLDEIDSDMLRVSPLIIQERHDDAFDVEKVQKDFFRTLKSIYDETIVPDIQKGIKNETKAKEAGLVLLNRLIFLYFIQKKGWLDKNPQYLLQAFEKFRSQTLKEDILFRISLLSVRRPCHQKIGPHV